LANKYREIPAETEEILEEQIPGRNDAPPKKAGKPRKKGVLAKGLSSVFSGTFLTNEKTISHLPFILFLALLAIFYIANGYYADDKVREANRLSNQLKELRSEYISTKSELMFTSKQSEVAKAVEGMGLREPVVPPMKIEVDSAELYKNIK
jgi:hypothetical protein